VDVPGSGNSGILSCSNSWLSVFRAGVLVPVRYRNDYLGQKTHFRISQSLLAYTGRTFLPQIAEQEGSQSRDSQRRFPWLSGPVSGRQAGKSTEQLRRFLNKLKGYTHGSAAVTNVQFLATRYQLFLQRLLHHPLHKQ